MAFKFKCPQCGGETEAQDEWEGQSADCPFCQAKVRIVRPAPRVPRVSIPTGQPSAMRQVRPIGRNPPDDKDDYCFWLGFWYWFFGLLIAAIIEGKQGVKDARKGMSVSAAVLLALCAGVYLVIGLLSSRH